MAAARHGADHGVAAVDRGDHPGGRPVPQLRTRREDRRQRARKKSRVERGRDRGAVRGMVAGERQWQQRRRLQRQLVAPAAGQVCSNVMTNPESFAHALDGRGELHPERADRDGRALGGGSAGTEHLLLPAYLLHFLSRPGAGGRRSGSVYQIDAVGYAGSPDTAAIVESTYLVQTSTKCLTCNPEN